MLRLFKEHALAHQPNKCIYFSTYPKTTISPGTLNLFLNYGRAEVMVREEFYAYDVNNFIADVGGFLGLLLGQSVLSLVDSIEQAASNLRTAMKTH